MPAWWLTRLVQLMVVTNRHTHPFNGPLSGTTRVSWYQKGKTNLDFTEARDSEWQWHQLGHMQVCTSLQTDIHASTPPLIFYRPDALPAAQPIASKHWRRKALKLFVANRQCSIIGLICVTCTMMCRFNLAWGWSRDTSWGNEVLISHCEFIWSMTSAYMPSLMTNNSLSKCVSLFIFIQICGFCSICGKHCKYVFIETALANNATETIVRLEAV